LQENNRRLGLYDRCLLRPRLVPTLAKGLCCVLREQPLIGIQQGEP